MLISQYLFQKGEKILNILLNGQIFYKKTQNPVSKFTFAFGAGFESVNEIYDSIFLNFRFNISFVHFMHNNVRHLLEFEIKKSLLICKTNMSE